MLYIHVIFFILFLNRTFVFLKKKLCKIVNVSSVNENPIPLPQTPTLCKLKKKNSKWELGDVKNIGRKKGEENERETFTY